MQTISIADTPVRDVTMPHGIGRVMFNDFLGQGHQVLPGPQAYLVNQLDARSEIYPHFHDVDQFQIFVGGSGRIGAHPLAPIVAHYVDAYAPYGPIVAQDRGVSYLALRLAAASGGWRMPENRHLIVGGPHRRITLEFDSFSRIPESVNFVERKTMWGPAEDGLEIASFHVGPHTEFVGDPPAGGQYIVVTGGALDCDGTPLPANSLIFLARGETAPTLRTSIGGATLLSLQFPLPSQRPGSDPSELANREGKYAMPPTLD